MTLLAIEGVVRRFRGVVALDDVSFTVEEGQIAGIMGANGAGKTTLFSIIAGNLRPQAGQIIFAGQRIDGLRPDQVSRSGIARTFQIVRPFGNLTVLENVTLGVLYGRRRERSVASAEMRARKILEQMGLADRAWRLARELTLAGRKRLEIARGLATEPRLLMLDEVLAGLTPAEVTDGIGLIRTLHQRDGLTIVMIEHVTRALMALCHRIVVLHHGKKIVEGSPEVVVRDPQTVSAYLGATKDMEQQ
jgi:branched-chain amino acid transport system ATP-binding protein